MLFISIYFQTDLHDSLPQTPFAQLLGGSSRLNTVEDGSRSSHAQHVASNNATTKEVQSSEYAIWLILVNM